MAAKNGKKIKATIVDFKDYAQAGKGRTKDKRQDPNTTADLKAPKKKKS